MNVINKTQAGFTLVEMAMVLVIIGLLLGGLLAPLSTQMEQDKRNKTMDMLEEVKEAMLGFAMANDRLPCPAVPNSAGVEAPPGGGTCTARYGFVPAVTLGLAGPTNLDGLLVDTWGNPIRYGVTTTLSTWAFTTTNSITFGLVPDLVVCDTVSGSNNSCSAGNTLASNIPAVLYSMGKDGAARPTSNEQRENGEARTAGGVNGPLGIRYWVNSNGDRVFANAGYRDDAGNEFDDLVTWISPNILYNRMVKAGALGP